MRARKWSEETGGWGWRMWSQWECFQPAAASESFTSPVRERELKEKKTLGGMKWETSGDVWMEERKRKPSLMKWEGVFWWHRLVQYPPLTSKPTSDFSPAATLCASPAGSLNKGQWLGRSSMTAEVGSSSDIEVIDCSLMSRICSQRESQRFEEQIHFVFWPQFFSLPKVYGPESISATLQAFIRSAERKQLITKYN